MQNGFCHRSARLTFSFAHIVTYTVHTQEILQDQLGTVLISPNLTAYVTGLPYQVVVSITNISIDVLSSNCHGQRGPCHFQDSTQNLKGSCFVKEAFHNDLRESNSKP